MPKSPIMGESVEKRSPSQLENESFVSEMAKEITIEKEKEKNLPL